METFLVKNEWENGERALMGNDAYQYIDKVMTFCPCWLAHTNPFCVRDSAETVKDKSRRPEPTIGR